MIMSVLLLNQMVMLPYGDEEYYVLDPSDDVDAQ